MIGQSMMIEFHIRWGEEVRLAECVLVIGVKPYSSDSHIWMPLAETDANLAYIGSDEAFHKWVSRYRNKKPSNFYTGDGIRDLNWF